METSTIAKWLLTAGVILLVLAGLFWLGAKWVPTLGKLPGDLRVHKEKFSVYFPVVTCIVVSVALTLVINLVLWLFRK